MLGSTIVSLRKVPEFAIYLKHLQWKSVLNRCLLDAKKFITSALFIRAGWNFNSNFVSMSPTFHMLGPKANYAPFNTRILKSIQIYCWCGDFGNRFVNLKIHIFFVFYPIGTVLALKFHKLCRLWVLFEHQVRTIIRILSFCAFFGKCARNLGDC